MIDVCKFIREALEESRKRVHYLEAENEHLRASLKEIMERVEAVQADFDAYRQQVEPINTV